MTQPETTTALEVARPNCAAEVLQDEIVALNVETGIYCSLRGAAVALWHDLDAGHPVERLAAHVGDADAVRDFAERLQRHGLMRPAAARPAPAGAPTAVAGEIVFEVYDDMQDLILSDPIHDVDESVGWPATGGS